jgi:hypothetical protein
MTSTSSPRTGRRRTPHARPDDDRPGPLVWQRTDTVGFAGYHAARRLSRLGRGTAAITLLNPTHREGRRPWHRVSRTTP